MTTGLQNNITCDKIIHNHKLRINILQKQKLTLLHQLSNDQR